MAREARAVAEQIYSPCQHIHALEELFNELMEKQ
jgi:hypothetical protein